MPLFMPVTGTVATGKVTFVAPAGAVIVAGTDAAELVVDNEITAPPLGAAPLNVAVPVEETPPNTEAGLTAIAARLAAVTVRVALFVTLL